MADYLVKRIVKYPTSFFTRFQGRRKRLTVVSIKPNQPAQGNVLISYSFDSFLLKSGQPLPNSHTHFWEGLQMINTFLEMGYCVDAISFFNDVFVPKKEYAFMIDSRWNMERLAPLLNKDCIKIMHIDIAHILFHNAAECNRLLGLQQRRGVTLRPRRTEPPNLAIEHADCATILGNEFTINTYKYAHKPIYRIPISTTDLYPWPEEKDFAACRKNFLWMGSGGLVHKGLDLVLDAFVQMPDYHLTICGPIQKEEDFVKAFYKELYHTPNIHTVGWVDVSGPKFLEIINSCIGFVYPSCSEGGGGSAIGCMHASLIPIVSYETSVDVHDFGVILSESSIEEIKSAVQMISNLPVEELKMRSRKTWEYARANHTRENFAQVYKETINKIRDSHSKK